jgi:uncharacterized protein (TIGR03067 family)
MFQAGAGLLVPVALAQGPGAKVLHGDWLGTAGWENGKPKDAIIGHVLAFTDKDFTVKDKDGKLIYAGIYTVDEAKTPATIDFVHTEGLAKGKTWLGIWKTGGKKTDPTELLICDNAADTAKARPKDFQTPTGSGHTMVEFKRKK